MAVSRRTWLGLACAAALGMIGAGQSASTKDFSAEGVYVEACTCKTTCAGEVTGEPTGCDVVGACRIDKGTYDGKDLAGTTLAFAVDHTDQVHLYLDAPEGDKRSALEAFARATLAALGSVKSVAAAKIDLTGKDGAYTVRVGGGKTMTVATEPVLGGDHKTPVALNNTLNLLNPTLYQGRCTGGMYADGEHRITIEKGRNAFFNAHMKASGKA